MDIKLINFNKLIRREDEIDETMEKLRTELENGCRNFLKKVQPDVLEVRITTSRRVTVA